MSLDEETLIGRRTQFSEQPISGREDLRGRLGVPWATVAPLAVVLAYANGFWTIVLRGAFGAVELTQIPFSTWLRESTLTLPLYLAAVLGVMTVALRRFGPIVRRPRAMASAGLLIVAAGSLVGIVGLVLSSAYDYHLQSTQLTFMNAMHGCTGTCVTGLQQSTLTLQVKSVLLGAGLILVTNIVLVGWMIAMLGGRLKVSTTRRQSSSAQRDGRDRSRIDDLRVLLGAALVGSAVIHAAVVPEHLTEWPAAGVFFIVLIVVEIGNAGLLFRRMDRAVLVGTAALSIGPLVVWLYSRTAGLPFGPGAGEPEIVGLPDVVACVLELTAVVVAVILIRAGTTLRGRPPASAHGRALIVATAIAVTTIGLAGTGLTLFSVFVDSGIPLTMTGDH